MKLSERLADKNNIFQLEVEDIGDDRMFPAKWLINEVKALEDEIKLLTLALDMAVCDLGLIENFRHYDCWTVKCFIEEARKQLEHKEK